MPDPTRNEKTRIRLNAEIGSYDKALIKKVIDDAPFCHVSTIVDGMPYIQPTVHWRCGDQLYIHGARKNKLINALIKGADACLAFSHFEGFVLARSAIRHSVAYRSAIVFSKGRWLESLEDREEALRQFIEHIEPDRWLKIRRPNREELMMTGVVELSLNDSSAKVMPPGPFDFEEDLSIPVWAGVIPYQLQRLNPVEDTSSKTYS